MNKIFLIALLMVAFSCNKEKVHEAVQDNRAYIVNGGSKDISVVDLTTLALVNNITLTSNDSLFPHHIYLSPDKLDLVIAIPEHDFSLGHNSLHNTPKPGGVSVVNLAQSNKVNTYSVANANHNAIFSPDGTEIWTAGYSHTGRVYVLDAKTGSLKQEVTVDADPSEVVFSSDGKYGLVTSGEGAFLQVIDVNSKELIKKIKVDLAPSNVWSGVDNKVLVSNALKKSINIVDLNELAVVDFIDLPFAPGFVAYHNDDIWISDALNNRIVIYLKTNDGYQVGPVILFDSADPHMFQFFDNGQKALVILQNKAQAVIIDTQTLEHLKTISVGQKPNGIAISSF